MKPFIHAKNSARKFGGKPEDYQKIEKLTKLLKLIKVEFYTVQEVELEV